MQISVFHTHFFEGWVCVEGNNYISPFVAAQFFFLNLRPASFLLHTLDVRAAQASTVFLYSQVQHLSICLGSFGLLAWAEPPRLFAESVKGFCMDAAL